MVIQNSPISEDAVREALDSLVSPTVRLTSDHPLCTLFMVDIFLSNPRLPKIDNAREFAVHRLLSEIITGEYTRQRAIFGLSSPKNVEILDEATQQILDDIAVDSLELMAWCVLYFVYVRVDFNLSLPTFSQKVGLVARTLRRYRSNGIAKLTTIIIMREWELRTTRRHDRIIAQLPEVKPVRLIGRDNELTLIQDTIQHKHNAHIQITGVGGIGKSVLVQESVRALLESDQSSDSLYIENLIWLNCPQSIQEILDAIHHEIGIENTQISLREFLTQYRLILVLDDVNLLSSSQLDELITILDSAIIFVISAQHILLKNIDLNLTVEELTCGDVDQLIRYLASNTHTQLPYSTEYLYKKVGGNPLAVRLCVSSPDLDFTYQDTAEIAQRVITQAIASLTDSQKHLCKTLTLFPDKLISIHTLKAYLPDWDDGDFTTLSKKYFFRTNRTNDNELYISLLPIVRRYFEIDIINHGLIEDFSIHITSQLSTFPELTLRIVAYLNRVFEVNAEFVGEIADKLRSFSSIRRTKAWHQLLNRYFVEPIDEASTLLLDYAITLRRMGQWKRCQMVLEGLLQHTGSSGDFELQVQATLELITLSRLQGEYRQAERLLARCEEVVARLELVELQKHLFLEKTQVAIDKGHGANAKQHLGEIDASERDLEWQIMFAEAELLDENFEECERCIHQILELTTARYDLGRLYTIRSQNFAEQKQYAEAKQYARASIAYFEGDERLNSLALARSQSNLGAILICLQQHEEAEELLLKAKQTQKIYNDRLGLEITRHNLRLLNNHLSSSNLLGTI